jgi:hypothetical protein
VICYFGESAVITRVYKVVIKLGNWDTSIYASSNLEYLFTDEWVEYELAAMNSEVLELLSHEQLILEEGISAALINCILAIYLISEHLVFTLVYSVVNSIALIGPHGLVSWHYIVTSSVAVCLSEEAVENAVVLMFYAQCVLYMRFVAVVDDSYLGFMM